MDIDDKKGRIPTTKKSTAAELAEGKTFRLDGSPKVGRIVAKKDKEGNLELNLFEE